MDEHIIYGLNCSFIEWLAPSGRVIEVSDWHRLSAMTLLLTHTDEVPSDDSNTLAVGLLLNASEQTLEFTLPLPEHEAGWQVAFSNSDKPLDQTTDCSWLLMSRSMAFLRISE